MASFSEGFARGFSVMDSFYANQERKKRYESETEYRAQRDRVDDQRYEERDARIEADRKREETDRRMTSLAKVGEAKMQEFMAGRPDLAGTTDTDLLASEFIKNNMDYVIEVANASPRLRAELTKGKSVDQNGPALAGFKEVKGEDGKLRMVAMVNTINPQTGDKEVKPVSVGRGTDDAVATFSPSRVFALASAELVPYGGGATARATAASNAEGKAAAGKLGGLYDGAQPQGQPVQPPQGQPGLRAGQPVDESLGAQTPSGNAPSTSAWGKQAVNTAMSSGTPITVDDDTRAKFPRVGDVVDRHNGAAPTESADAGAFETAAPEPTRLDEVKAERQRLEGFRGTDDSLRLSFPEKEALRKRREELAQEQTRLEKEVAAREFPPERVAKMQSDLKAMERRMKDTDFIASSGATKKAFKDEYKRLKDQLGAVPEEALTAAAGRNTVRNANVANLGNPKRAQTVVDNAPEPSDDQLASSARGVLTPPKKSGRPSREQLEDAVWLAKRGYLSTEQLTRYARTGQLDKPAEVKLQSFKPEEDLYLNGVLVRKGVPSAADDAKDTKDLLDIEAKRHKVWASHVEPFAVAAGGKEKRDVAGYTTQFLNRLDSTDTRLFGFDVDRPEKLTAAQRNELLRANEMANLYERENKAGLAFWRDDAKVNTLAPALTAVRMGVGIDDVRAQLAQVRQVPGMDKVSDDVALGAMAELEALRRNPKFDDYSDEQLLRAAARELN